MLLNLNFRRPRLDAGQSVFFISREATVPDFAQLFPGNAVPFVFPRERGQHVLFFGRRNPAFRSQCFNLFGAERKLVQNCLRHTGDLPALFRSFNSVANLSQPFGEPGVKGGFVVRRVPFQIAELPGLPALLHIVPCGVESEAVRVQVRVWNALDRTRREMMELRPNQIASVAVTVFTPDPDARFHVRFQFSHRFRDRHFERAKNPFIPILLVHDRHRLWAMEIEIVTDTPVFLRSRG